MCVESPAPGIRWISTDSARGGDVRKLTAAAPWPSRSLFSHPPHPTNTLATRRRIPRPPRTPYVMEMSLAESPEPAPPGRLVHSTGLDWLTRLQTARRTALSCIRARRRTGLPHAYDHRGGSALREHVAPHAVTPDEGRDRGEEDDDPGDPRPGAQQRADRRIQ